MKTKLLITLVFAMTITSFNTQAQAPAIDWEKSFGGTSADEAVCTKQTPDGGYIATGFTYSEDGDVFVNHGHDDYWIAKLDDQANIQWSSSFGGSKKDEAYFVCLTSGGSYILAGLSYSNDGDATTNHGDADYWIVKIDAIGNLQWQKSFGGSGFDKINCIEQTSDGGYIVAGYSNSNDGDVTGNHGHYDYWVVKITDGGNIEWQKSFGGSDNEKAYSIKQTPDGGYAVFGFAASIDGDVTGNHGLSDYWLVKLDASGNLQWQKTYGGTESDKGAVLALDPDGYVMTGQSQSSDGDATFNHGGYDYWIVKTDFDGNILWQESYGGSSDDISYSVNKTTGNGYIVSGFSSSNDGDVTVNHGEKDVWVIKLHSDGSLNWELSLGGTTKDVNSFVEQTSDGGYIVTCTSNSVDGDVTGNHGDDDYWVVKLGADLATGIPTISDAQSVYPNPFLNYIMFPDKVEFVKITNWLGRTVTNKVFNNKVNTEELPPGVYFAEFTSNGVKNIMKLVKQ